MPEPFAPLRPQLLRPEALVGAASPLWAYFTGAAMTGVAWWWMTRWMRPAGLEALAAAALEPAAEAIAQAVELESMAEAAMEPALQAVAEAAGGPVAEALVSEETPVLPVGGEAAPFGAAVLEAELISEPGLAADLSQPADLSKREEPAPARRPPPRARKPREGQAKPH